MGSTPSVGDSIFGQGPAGKSEIRELRLTYALEDEIHNTIIPKGEKVYLEQPRPVPVITLADGSATISSPYNGKFTYTIDKSAAKTVEMKNLPEPIVLSGAWELSLPQGSGVSSKKTFSVLRSWSKSEDEEVRYYSGSVSYKKKFTIANDMISKGRSLKMDLGSAREIAEVILNGKNLGIQWIAPFRVDITEAVLPGENNMEIRVTNLWVNRLIGDAQQPDDLKWNEGDLLRSGPNGFLTVMLPGQSKRRTFAAWRHWAARSLLKPSGLLGPVVIRSYQNIRL